MDQLGGERLSDAGAGGTEGRAGVTRREAGLGFLLVAAGLASGAGPVAALAQVRPPREERERSGRPALPAGAIVGPGKTADYTLRIAVTVKAYQDVSQRGVTVIPFNFDTAAVVFPVNTGTASSQLLPSRGLKAELSVDDKVIVDQSNRDRFKYQDGYQAGTRLARWEAQNLQGRTMQLRLELPMRVWETLFDEGEAMKVPPTERWPEPVASALTPDQFTVNNEPVIDPASRDVQALVRKSLRNADPARTPPARVAKLLTAGVIEGVQISGNGLRSARTGELEGLDLQSSAQTASRGRGSEFDVVSLLVAMMRAAGVPARVVIGWDKGEQDAGNRRFLDNSSRGGDLRAWAEFCIRYDEARRSPVWVPVDPVRLRKSGSRAPSLDRVWKHFGACEELEFVLPFAFQYHPPTTVVAHGSPGFWGWLTTPEVAVAEQRLRFDSFTTARTAETQREDREERQQRSPSRRGI